jgi:hypothetical protein
MSDARTSRGAPKLSGCSGKWVGVKQKIKNRQFFGGSVSVASTPGQGGVTASWNETQKVSYFAERKEGK